MLDTLFQHFLKHRAVTTDTRKISPHAIYFALKGERFNGNQFAKQALDAGCDYAVVDEDPGFEDARLVRVENALQELQDLSSMYREHFFIPFLAITGSNGKTTTKELVSAVLSKKYKVYATRGNLNNHIGVPLTLLEIPEDTTFAVIEMGANHQGEIESYCLYASPDYGLITNIGKAHLEGFGGVEGVKKGKKELFDFVNTNGGKVFVNVELENLTEVSMGMSIIPYGFNSGGMSLRIVKEDPYLVFEYEVNGKKAIVNSKLTGAYNLYNFASAAAVGRFFGVDFNDQVAAMEAYDPDNNRSQVVKTERNTLIMDAYNANPSSMEHALINLSKQGEKTFFVMGDMRELGEEGPVEHRSMIQKAKELGLNGVLVGSVFAEVATADDFIAFADKDAARTYLSALELEGHTILIKGSRGIQLEVLKDIF
ncbi:MAG: UDP-N-acetylmuramoyl-tripeptide--D-alanyl-D-alanine ligase [Flavobacteriales bacterium]